MVSKHPNLNEGCNAEWAVRLEAILDDRVQLLRDLESTTARQDDAIVRRDVGTLAELLASRQTVVDRFVAGQSELLELTQTLADRAAEVPRETVDALQAQMRVVFDGLSRIAAHDDMAHAALRAARDEARAELDRANVGGGAVAAYAARRVGGAVYADRKA
ncbi:MAG: hypothetical protein JNM94_02125 [Phycisphaerae bacterium]|nr:hypothetical protein [Phycisphaerae bacterium]